MLGVSSEAAEDLRYLLGRGYGRISSVKFVGDKYLFDKPQRLLLYRGVYPPAAATAHSKKLVAAGDLHRMRLSVDGYNVLLTINSALKGVPVFLCDDGFVRDVSEIHSSASKEDLTKPLAQTVAALRDLETSGAHFVFDRLISKSGEFSKQVAQELRSNSVAGGASTATSADFEVLKRGEIVSSSDSIIIEKAERVFDLAAYVIVNRLHQTPPKI
jgi:hypothetical protein